MNHAEAAARIEPATTERLDAPQIRALQLEASRLQLNVANLTGEQRQRYEDIMNTLRENGADDWGD